ncbi:hypothetical protein REPUB_Repub02eG0168000 [Reevesia pubescens]
MDSLYSESVLKFNVDGATRPADCGGVLRDFNGAVLGLSFGLLGVLYSNMAEVHAIKGALQEFFTSSWFKKKALIIESDSKVALSWVCNKNLRSWKEFRDFNVIDRIVQLNWYGGFFSLLLEENSFADF